MSQNRFMSDPATLSRLDFLKTLVVGAMAAAAPFGLAQEAAKPKLEDITIDDLRSFAKIAGLSFSDAELEQARKDIATDRQGYSGLREVCDDYNLTSPTAYRAPGFDKVGPFKVDVKPAKVALKRPGKPEDIAFLTVNELGHLLRSRQITATELTTIYLDRLKTYGPKLLCVVTLTEQLALKQAAQADKEMATGKFRGPLHGIPYGIKDLFAVAGYPTQWGTAAFKGQVIDENCAVFEKLTQAGAICLAKLSLGALAMNDNWFGGRTKNPWKPSEGSSGSSAGSASAMAAGLVAFGIGTETSGSIVSPSQRCRVTGLRPTFGSISRYGAMCLSWTMDKVGALCRTAEDAALVVGALVGKDERDFGSIDRPWVYRTSTNLKGWKIGVLGKQDAEYAQMLASLGASLAEFKLPKAIPGLDAIIGVEAAAMFDTITRNGKLNLVTENQWPQIFRAARFMPAVEYAQAERGRARLAQAFEEAFAPYDVVVANGSAGPLIYNSNLTGHPQIHVPFRPAENGAYTSFSMLAKPFEESKLVAAAHLVQMKTQFFRLRPDLSSL
jgi:Asp-tRNA(Asn)/Glu-tRNA(Gln) amidotransferase A subunit family amidase